MSYQEENLFYEQSTDYTLEEAQIRLQVTLSTTTSSNKKTYLETASRYGVLIGDDNMDSKLESLCLTRINNPFDFNHINNLNKLNIYDSSEKEDDFNFDNLPNSVYNILNNDIVIEIPLEVKNENDAENVEGSFLKEIPNSLLNRKRDRNEPVIIYKRKDNGRRGIARFFFNHYLIGLIEEMKDKCSCFIHFASFPEKFIFEVAKKKRKDYLDYTFEELLENKDLYKGKDPDAYYSINIKVVEALKSEKNKVILENYGLYKNFKMTYKNLYKKFLKSELYTKHYEKLLKTKGEVEAENFKHFANIFLE